ncbi:unnamed protein product [Boreogadus saida]
MPTPRPHLRWSGAAPADAWPSVWPSALGVALGVALGPRCGPRCGPRPSVWPSALGVALGVAPWNPPPPLRAPGPARRRPLRPPAGRHVALEADGEGVGEEDR